MTSRYSLSSISGYSALIIIGISKIVELLSGAKIAAIAWLASLLVLVSAYSLYRDVDRDKFSEVIKSTSIIENESLDPNRYINGILIAMIIGFIATITIHYHFIAGMLVYLIMQLTLIYSFSGIHSLRPSNYSSEYKAKIRMIIVGWILIIALVYIFLVYNEPDSLVVIPYVIALGAMAHYTWYGYLYTGRPKAFRLLLLVGAAIFVFSDGMIGNNVFGANKAADEVYLLIDVTYVLAIFMISKAGQYILAEH